MVEGALETFKPRPNSSQMWRIAWPAALAWCAFFPIAQPFAFAVGWKGLKYGYWTYNAGFAALSWFDTGFARRELEGTLISLFTPDPMVGAGWFHLISCTILAGLGIWLASLSSNPRRLQVILGAVLISILVRLGTDVGRTDAAVMVCGILAAWAVREARWTIAANLVFVALLFHETGVIVLAPMLAGVLWTSDSRRRWRSIDGALACGVLALAAVVYALGFGIHANIPMLARRIHSSFAVNPELADLAVSVNLAGSRGVETAMCINLHNPVYPVRVAGGVLLCILFTLGLQPARWPLGLAVTVPAFLFLSLIATDIGRWATMAAFTLFTLTALEEPPQGRSEPQAPQIAFAIAGALLMASFLSISDVGPPIPIAEVAGRSLRIKSSTWVSAYSACDPGWRRSIGI